MTITSWMFNLSRLALGWWVSLNFLGANFSHC